MLQQRGPRNNRNMCIATRSIVVWAFLHGFFPEGLFSGSESVSEILVSCFDFSFPKVQALLYENRVTESLTKLEVWLGAWPTISCLHYGMAMVQIKLGHLEQVGVVNTSILTTNLARGVVGVVLLIARVYIMHRQCITSGSQLT